jgi:hypothetical protein
MRDGLSLCAHLAALAPGPAPFTIAPEEILDWYDGPMQAVARCRTCGACGWLEYLDWDLDGEQRLRIFALAAIGEADVALYLRDRARGSCDAGRAPAELEALAASAGPFERLVAVDLAGPSVVAASNLEPGFTVPAGWSLDRIPKRDDNRWFARLGLEKTRR